MSSQMPESPQEQMPEGSNDYERAVNFKKDALNCSQDDVDRIKEIISVYTSGYIQEKVEDKGVDVTKIILIGKDDFFKKIIHMCFKKIDESMIPVLIRGVPLGFPETDYVSINFVFGDLLKKKPVYPGVITFTRNSSPNIMCPFL